MSFLTGIRDKWFMGPDLAIIREKCPDFDKHLLMIGVVKEAFDRFSKFLAKSEKEQSAILEYAWPQFKKFTPLFKEQVNKGVAEVAKLLPLAKQLGKVDGKIDFETQFDHLFTEASNGRGHIAQAFIKLETSLLLLQKEFELIDQLALEGRLKKETDPKARQLSDNTSKIASQILKHLNELSAISKNIELINAERASTTILPPEIRKIGLLNIGYKQESKEEKKG